MTSRCPGLVGRATRPTPGSPLPALATIRQCSHHSSTADHRDLRLHAGCGSRAVTSWVNIDRSTNILLECLRTLKSALYWSGLLSDGHMAPWPRNIVEADVRKGLPYPNESAVAIYWFHMLEHPYFNDAQTTLREFRRLLSHSRVLRLALPDSEQTDSKFLAALASGAREATISYNLALNAHPLGRPTGARRIATKLGSSVHRWQPTRALVFRC